MNIRHIISGISLAATLGLTMLAPVQSQAEERRHGYNGERYEQRGHSDGRDTRHYERRHDKRHDKRHGRYRDNHHAYNHRGFRRGHRQYSKVCRLPQHRHFGRHGHSPKSYGDNNVHGRVRYNVPGDWRVVLKF